MAGNCETITNSASAEARVEAWAELGNITNSASAEARVEAWAELGNTPTNIKASAKFIIQAFSLRSTILL